MAAPPFKSDSEEAYAQHLTLVDLSYEYEKQWGKYHPDFTIHNGASTEPIAIADVKDLRHSPQEEAILAAGQILSIHRDPALRTRRQIYGVWRQFEACADYPCMLVLASGGDWLPDPLFVIAAMLGDYTISMSVSRSISDRAIITQSFGKNGKMVDKHGSPRHTRISAIGLLSAVCPDVVYSGFGDKVNDLAEQFLSEGTDKEATRLYSDACNDLKMKLTADGYDLESVVPQVEYVVNPLAAKPFPKMDLAHGYVKVWKYDLSTQTLDMTYDWAKLSKPSNGR